MSRSTSIVILGAFLGSSMLASLFNISMQAKAEITDRDACLTLAYLLNKPAVYPFEVGDTDPRASGWISRWVNMNCNRLLGVTHWDQVQGSGGGSNGRSNVQQPYGTSRTRKECSNFIMANKKKVCI